MIFFWLLQRAQGATEPFPFWIAVVLTIAGLWAHWMITEKDE